MTEKVLNFIACFRFSSQTGLFGLWLSFDYIARNIITNICLIIMSFLQLPNIQSLIKTEKIDFQFVKGLQIWVTS